MLSQHERGPKGVSLPWAAPSASLWGFHSLTSEMSHLTLARAYLTHLMQLTQHTSRLYLLTQQISLLDASRHTFMSVPAAHESKG